MSEEKSLFEELLEWLGFGKSSAAEPEKPATPSNPVAPKPKEQIVEPPPTRKPPPASGPRGGRITKDDPRRRGLE